MIKQQQFKLNKYHQFLNTMIFVSFSGLNMQYQWVQNHCPTQASNVHNCESSNLLQILSYALKKSLQTYSNSTKFETKTSQMTQDNQSKSQKLQKQRCQKLKAQLSSEKQQQYSEQFNDNETKLKKTLSIARSHSLKKYKSIVSQQKIRTEQFIKPPPLNFTLNRQPKKFKRIAKTRQDKDQDVIMPYKQFQACGSLVLPQLGSLLPQNLKNKKRKLLRRKVTDWNCLEQNTIKRR